MGLRPSICYREVKNPAYTRFSRRTPKKSYIKGVPGSKVVMYDMGHKTGVFPVEVHLVSLERMQLRHNALEAARVASNKYLSGALGKFDFRLRLRVFPHHVLRENPLATGAGADRFSSGMKLAFGKAIGRTARVRADQRIMTVYISSDALIPQAKEALRLARAKLPNHCAVEVERKDVPAAAAAAGAPAEGPAPAE